MKHKSTLLALLTIPFITGCSFLAPKDTTDPDEPDPIIDPDEDGDDDPVDIPDLFKDDNALYQAFFDFKSNIAIELTFSNEAIYKLAQYGEGDETDFAHQEMYHPCTAKITINDQTMTYTGMGARMKGNTSRNDSFVDENGRFDKASSRWFNMKLSFTETFQSDEDCDYYKETFKTDTAKQERKDRRFGAMKKFDLKWNKNYDNTFTKESYANYILREEGLISQKTNLVKLTVNSDKDSFTDTFQVLECVDKQSLKRNFSSKAAKGNLYKGSWPINFTKTNSIGVESANYKPTYDLKTNDDTPDHTVIKNFLNVVNTEGSIESVKSQLESVVDIEYFLKYAAMMWVIGNPDDLRYNTNNTYVYFDSVHNLMYPIPYDNDRCFGILVDWEMDMSTRYITSTKKVDGSSWNENPLLWRTIIEEKNTSVTYSDRYPVNPEWRGKYIDYCIEYANKYLDADKFQSFTNQFPLAKKDISIGGKNNLSFETYATNKLNAIANEMGNE